MTNDFQRRAGQQGRAFEDICRLLLAAAGFTQIEKKRIKEIGIEIDLAAVSPTGKAYWFNCKGSWAGSRPGLIRTDTLKKAIAEAYICKYGMDSPPMVLLTSHMPKNSGALWLSLLNGDIFDAVICVNDPRDVEKLKKLGETA